MHVTRINILITAALLAHAARSTQAQAYLDTVDEYRISMDEQWTQISILKAGPSF